MSNPSLSLTNPTGSASPSSLGPLRQPPQSSLDPDPCHVTTIFHNLSAIRSQMESLQGFLSISSSCHVIIGSQQMQMVSTEIANTLCQLIKNGNALLVTCQYPDCLNSLGQLSTEMDHDPAEEEVSDKFIVAETNEDVTKVATATDNLQDETISDKFINRAGENEDATEVTAEGNNPPDESICNTFSNIDEDIDGVTKVAIAASNRNNEKVSDKYFNFVGKIDDMTKISTLGYKWEIIELSGAQLLGDRKHYCHYCSKGFKRYSNMPTHIRTHKESRLDTDKIVLNTRFSCPILACDRNKSHKSFKPLKSVVCVKNHYRRCRCPKMYSCTRCNKKNFSVLADLKGHMKQCGETLFKCSCGTSFSRWAKLVRHVELFKGHKAMDMQKCDDFDKAKGEEESSLMVDEEEGEMENFSDDEFFEGLL